jgi:hypothetical protein
MSTHRSSTAPDRFPRRPLLACGLAATLALFLVPPGFAQILGMTGQIVRPASVPHSLLDGDFSSDTQIAVIREVENFPLPEDVTVNLSQEGTYPTDPETTAVLTAGTRVNSYLLHVDPVTTTGTVFLGGILFHEEILGINYRDRALDNTDPVVGHPRILYPTEEAWRGSETYISDVLTWSGSSLDVSCEVTGAMDQIRVFTRAPDLFFSIDIGSDTEFSDPAADGNEIFDPGCIYVSDAFESVGSAVQLEDDDLSGLLLTAPEAPLAAPYGCIAPAAVCYRSVLDLDGYDRLQVELGQYLPGPIFLDDLSPAERRGIHRPHQLVVSYDDDPAEGWHAGALSLPTGGFSPTHSTYGSTTHRDELWTVLLQGAVPPLALRGLDPRESEQDLHIGLGPDPDPATGQAVDDDVDALDVIPPFGPSQAPQRRGIHLFSVDHEGLGAILLPGRIYASSNGIPTTVIDPSKHLGLPSLIDLDAFEFAWLLIDAPSTWALALIFSVDQDDPLTAVDESGGLDPATLYGSFLDGNAFVLTERLDDDIDALAIEPGTPRPSQSYQIR